MKIQVHALVFAAFFIGYATAAPTPAPKAKAAAAITPAQVAALKARANATVQRLTRWANLTAAQQAARAHASQTAAGARAAVLKSHPPHPAALNAAGASTARARALANARALAAMVQASRGGPGGPGKP